MQEESWTWKHINPGDLTELDLAPVRARTRRHRKREPETVWSWPRTREMSALDTIQRNKGGGYGPHDRSKTKNARIPRTDCRIDQGGSKPWDQTIIEGTVGTPVTDKPRLA